MRATLALVLDVAIVLLLSVIAAVLVTGGGSLDLGFVRLRARSLTNPALFLSAAVVVRYALARGLPFLRIARFDVDRLSARSRALATAAARAHAGVGRRQVAMTLASLSVLALAVKLASAWFHPGFFSGDDVEIHEMTLAALWDRNWPIWNLRNACFPMAFIYPVQRVVSALGVADPGALVFAGRGVVAVLSTATIVLTWKAARLLVPGSPRVALLAAVFVTFNKVLMSFGSTELPRPVAAALAVAAFACLLRPDAWRTLLAGVLLGTAAALRFSELLLFAPATIMLVLDRRRGHAAVLLLAGAATAAGVIGLSDHLYWGEPFDSLRHIVHYTLISGASSRGYESTFAYFVLLPQWTNWVVFGLAVVGSVRRPSLGVWIWLPIAALSLLPHKETRYLIPIAPFVCLAAALGFVEVMRVVEERSRPRLADAVGVLLVPLLAIGLLQDAGGWRLPRTDEETRLAAWFRERAPGGVALSHLWRGGGRVYLGENEPLIDIGRDPRFASPAGRVEMFKDVRWIVVDAETARVLGEQELGQLGFEVDVDAPAKRLRVYKRRT